MPLEKSADPFAVEKKIKEVGGARDCILKIERGAWPLFSGQVAAVVVVIINRCVIAADKFGTK